MYRTGACLLDPVDPSKVISSLDYPILEPSQACENLGFRHETVFANGAATIDDKIYLYYGGADQFVCVCFIKTEDLLSELLISKV